MGGEGRTSDYHDFRFHKNKVEQKPGWNWEMLLWCLNEAKKNNLQEQDFWGGLILNEIKIQVNVIRPNITHSFS